MKKIFLLLNIAFLIIITVVPHASAEYNLATEEEELILISDEKEVKMGETLSKEVVKKFQLAQDPLLQKRINDIGQKIVKTCDRKDIDYYFSVLLGPDLKPENRINAFALPGGYIYIFKDLVEMLDSDDEIAAILAHEVGHITAKHSIKRLQGSYGLAALQILVVGSPSSRETKLRAHSAVGLLMMAYSREDEFMADKLGVKYLKLAGFNPEGSVGVIDKLIDIQRKAPIREYSGFRTHPYLAERKAIVRKEIHGRMEFDDYINLPE